MQLSIYTDGSFYQGEGGWAAVFVASHQNKSIVRYIAGYDPKTTNNRMEILAVLEALRKLRCFPYKLDECVIIYSDSQYVINSINDWLDKWIENHIFRTKKNTDLWDQYLNLRDDLSLPISYQWVKGHAGDKYNELADQLAGEARIKKANTRVLTAC